MIKRYVRWNCESEGTVQFNVLHDFSATCVAEIDFKRATDLLAEALDTFEDETGELAARVRAFLAEV